MSARCINLRSGRPVALPLCVAGCTGMFGSSHAKRELGPESHAWVYLMGLGLIGVFG